MHCNRALHVYSFAWPDNLRSLLPSDFVSHLRALPLEALSGHRPLRRLHRAHVLERALLLLQVRPQRRVLRLDLLQLPRLPQLLLQVRPLHARAADGVVVVEPLLLRGKVPLLVYKFLLVRLVLRQHPR
eukprot:3707825-Pyramimonas_sp.AAC.1